MELSKLFTGESNIVGRGQHGIIYGLGDSQVVKIYHNHVPLEVLYREYLVSLALDGRYFPVAKPFGTKTFETVNVQGEVTGVANGLVMARLPGVDIKREILLKMGNRVLHDELEQRVFYWAKRALEKGFTPIDEGTQNARYDPVEDKVYLFDFASWGLPGELPDKDTGKFYGTKTIRLK